MLWIMVAVLVVIGIGGGVYAWQMLQGTTTTNSNTNTTNTASNDNVNQAVNENLNTNTSTNTNTVVDSTPGTVLGTVKWTAAKDIPTVKLYIVSSEPYSFDPNASATMQEIGTVTSGTFKDGTIIRYSYREDGPVLYPTYSYLIRQGTKYTLLSKNSYGLTSYEGGPQLDTKLVTVNTTDELPGLRFPDTIQGPKARQTLVQDKGVNAMFSADGLTKVFTDKTWGAVYMKEAKLPSSVDYNSNASVDAFMAGTVFSTRNGFYLKAPDGTVRVYKLVPDVLTLTKDDAFSGKLNATWSDTTLNTDTFDFTFHSGCGSLNYINAIPASDLSVTKDLRQTGTTTQGDAIYELKDQNNKLLTDFYASTVYYDPNATEQKQVPYTQFVTMHPMIFWVDPFGRLIQMTNGKFTTLAECGKPVIYLYPKTTTNVDVQLAPEGGFSVTEPAYGNGWQVTASPDGKLVERSTGKTYPYLFWEGRGGLYTDPQQGFVVAQADVHGFLVTSLTKLGLNDQERADFIEFWEPRMQGHPYYRVAFFGNSMMNKLAPMQVTPKPDSVIRILMDFRPLDQPITIEPQELHTPTRTGFTVVEWGGVLR